MSIWMMYPARRYYPLSIWEPIFITFDQPTKNDIMSDRAVIYYTKCPASVSLASMRAVSLTRESTTKDISPVSLVGITEYKQPELLW